MPEIIAVRRNLSPGAVFFRQRDNVVEYSLDRVSWSVAFILPGERGLSEPELNYYIDKTINQFVTDYGNQFVGNVTVNDLVNVSTQPTPSRLERNLCAASKALASTFAAMVNVHLEDENDGQLDLISSGLAFAAAALEIGARVFGKFIGEIAVKWINRAFMGNLAGSAAAGWWADLENVPDLTDCDVQEMACAIYRAATSTGADRSSISSALIMHFDFDACPEGNMNTALTEWFSVWIDTWPELWTAFLAGLTDAEVISCRDCGGCYDVNLHDEVTHNGLYIWNAGIRSAQRSDAYEPTNWKYLEVIHEIPDATASTQIDKVTVTWTQNGWATQSGLTWGSNWYIACQIAGPNNQSAFRSVNPPVPRYAQTTQEFDFTTDTLPFGVDKITVTMRIVYASTAQGKQSLHPLYDAILNDLKICVRS